MPSTTTLLQIKQQVYALMNETSNNNTYNASGRDTQKINDVVRGICSGFVISLLDPTKFYKTNTLSFLRNRQYMQYKQPIPTTADINPGDVVINVDTTDFDSAGSVYIQGTVINYTSKSATQLLGCTGIISKFTSGSYLTKCFKVNADFDRSYRVFFQYNNVQREVFEVQREDENFQRAKYQSFVVVQDETSGDKYIVIRGFRNDDRFIMKYYESVTNMVNDTDICIIPDERALKVVPAMVAGELLMESQTEDTEYISKLTVGYGKLQEMYNKYTLQEVDLEKMARQKPYNYSSINSFGLANTRYTRSGFTVY